MRSNFLITAAICLALPAESALSQPVGPGGLTDSVQGDLVIDNGDLVIRDAQNNVRARFDSGSGNWFSFTPEGRQIIRIEQGGANIFAGGGQSGQDGDLVLFSETALNQQTGNASIHLDGGAGAIRLGGGGERGQMALRNPGGDQHIFLDGGDALVVVGNSGQRGRLEMRNAGGDATAALDGATGRIRAQQVVSRESGQGGSEGIDSASVYIESANPALAFRDTTGGNTSGWYVQAGSTGRLIFQTGTPSGLGERVLVLDPDGSVCLGNCN